MYNSRAFKLICLCCLLLFSVSGFAQDTLNSESVDIQSYQLWQQQKWKELEAFGKKALKAGFDSYYLRMRLGIAYFSDKNYVKAQKQFEKAAALNASDDALSYIYYCYIYTERYDEARWISKSFSKELAHSMKTDSLSPINFIMLQGGEQVSDSSSKIQPGYFAQVSLDHTIANRISLFHALTYFYQPDSVDQSTELQYYLAANVPLKRNWDISPAFQWIDRGDPVITPGAKPIIHPGQPPPPKPKATVNMQYSSYFTGSLEVKKTFNRVELALTNTISKLFNDETMLLHTATISYHPIEWSAFYVGANVYLQTENQYSTNYVAYKPFAGVRVIKPITLSVSYLEHKGGPDVIEDNGYYINNSKDPTRSRLSLSLNCTLSRLIDVYGVYQYENQLDRTYNFPYTYNVFLLGLRIKP